MKDIIFALSNLRGVSGFEYSFSDRITEYFKPYCDRCFKDALGNVIAEKKCGLQNAPKIMIEGHIDEIGLMVTDIDENGFVAFTEVGGIDERILPSSEVILHGKKDIKGVILSKPPHLQTEEENKKPVKMKDMAIDTGYSREELLKLINIGTPITFEQSVGELLNDTVSSKALDDRAGVAVIIDVMRMLSDKNLKCDVYAVATVQEEVGLRGAKTASQMINPDISISIDVTHGITPDNSENAFKCGSGTIISTGPNIHPKVYKRLLETAKKASIPYEIEVEGGYTGTNAWVIQIANEGVATALLSIPLKYMHNPVETISIKDAEATRDLIAEFIKGIDSDWEGWLCY